MSFTSRNGTRGSFQPDGWLIRWFNRRVMSRLRRRGGTFRGLDTVVLGTIGKKTGEQRFVPVASFPSDGGGWIVVASANGAPRNPAWYYNIAAHPGSVLVQLAGKETPVDAEELHGAERAAAWERVIATAPWFRDYAKATDREIPVIRLTAKPAP